MKGPTLAKVADRCAGGLFLLNGLGFGIPAIIGAAHRARTGTTWTLMGFPAYETYGPFNAVGLQISPALMAGFAAVCAVEVAAGVLLLVPTTAGRVIAVASVPLGAVYWAGFALPFAPPLAAGGLVLLLVSRSLRTAKRVR